MNLLLNRLFDSGSETIGILYFKTDKLRYIYILEDTYNEKKIPGSTRIPAGQYEIKLLKEGDHYTRYCNHPNSEISALTKKYGILWLQDVPNFEGIIIHIGNTKADTRGCLLTGNFAHNFSSHYGLIENSLSAYIYLCKSIFPVFDLNQKVFITIMDSDREILKQFNNGFIKR